jgi:hypothetical protein
MPMRLRLASVLAFLLLASSALTQDSDSERDATREKLATLLADDGKLTDIKAPFRQSTKEPYNFIAEMKGGFASVDSLEVVLRVTTNDTISVRVYPHYKHGYINLEKVKDKSGLMQRMLNLSDRNFLFWGADDTSDVFCGYSFTLESGFPEKAITVVLRSIRNTDKFIGQLRPFIDGSAAVTTK